MHLAGLDHKNIYRTAFERLSVHRPHSSSFSDELDLIVRMPMRPRTGSRLPMEQEHRNIGSALFRSNKLMRTTDKRQLLLPHVVHIPTLC